MITIASVVLLSGETLLAARPPYPSTPFYVHEGADGQRRVILDDVQWAERIRQAELDCNAQDSQAGKQFVERQIEASNVTEERLSEPAKKALVVLKQLVAVARER